MIKHFLIFFTLVLPVLALEQSLQSKELSSKDLKSQNKEIAKLAAAEISKSLPQKVDKYTTLISCEAKNTTLIYVYEINTAPKSDAQVKKEDYDRMKKAVTYGTCKNSNRFLDADISIRYIYKSFHSKSELFKFDITKESCISL